MKNTIFKIIKTTTLLLSLFNLLMYFSMRCCWSGISKTLGYEDGYNQLILDLPLIIFFVLLAISITNILLFKFMKKENNLWAIIITPINIIFSIAVVVIIALGAIDYMYFIIPEFIKVCIVCALVFFVMFMIFIYPKTNLVNSVAFKYSIFSALLLIAVFYVINFSINTINYKPVVYAVEDNYQIVFGTSAEALGWVEIDGVKYTDTYAGSEKSFTKVHKIEVPMKVLDEAKGYKIYSQKFFYRGPFGAIKDVVISESYNFKGVDASDGKIDYYAMADIHMELDGTLKACDYNKDKEFLVLAGDIISFINTHDDAFYTGKVAHEITKGEMPVVYARGNHEIKGDYSEEFYKYVGSKNEDFYYNFYFDNIYGMVLDLGEDHDDDWWEYYETAHFAEYQKEQAKWLENELKLDEENKYCYKNYDYRMLVCHIPVNYINSRKNHTEIKKELTTLLNQFDLDISLSGHQHDLWVFEPNTVTPFKTMPYNPDYKSGKNKGNVTDFNFPAFLISKRGLTQTDSDKLTQKSQIGLSVKVDLNANIQTVIYNNSNGDKVYMVNPFANIAYGEEIVIDLTTKVFKKK